jgi:hypothetical protein
MSPRILSLQSRLVSVQHAPFWLVGRTKHRVFRVWWFQSKIFNICSLNFVSTILKHLRSTSQKTPHIFRHSEIGAKHVSSLRANFGGVFRGIFVRSERLLNSYSAVRTFFCTQLMVPIIVNGSKWKLILDNVTRNCLALSAFVRIDQLERTVWCVGLYSLCMHLQYLCLHASLELCLLSPFTFVACTTSFVYVPAALTHAHAHARAKLWFGYTGSAKIQQKFFFDSSLLLNVLFVL